MTSTSIQTIATKISAVLSEINRDEWTRQYWEQGEFIAKERLMPSSLVDKFMREVDGVRPKINRNFIYKHKKGGSVSYHVLQQSGPAILSLYQHQDWINLLSHIAGVPLLLCPDEDPHACALYFYTEPGDHIGYHYDTSYYNGARYTVLIGLRDQSSSRCHRA